jgi:outer membrane receptor for ferric coprogen and ferric-rhodotorulic acid
MKFGYQDLSRILSYCIDFNISLDKYYNHYAITRKAIAPFRAARAKRAQILALESLASVLVVGTLMGPAHAEAAANDAAASGSGYSDIVVQAQKPTDLKTSAIGLDISIVDTPRSITSIDASQLRDQSIQSVLDLARVVPSAYTTTQFGGANIPALRGQSAEVFQNGIWRTTRSNGLPLSFNAVEGLDVVKGPAGVVYGPTGNVGGYVNFVAKAPQMDGFHGSANLSYGSWNDKRSQIDVGGPLSDTLAVRLSYERIDAKSYYRLGYTDSHDIYGAIRFEPNDRLSIDANIEYYTANFIENTGINRPTQQLVDSGLYYQGTGVSPFGSTSDPRNFLSVINVTGVVPINRRDQLVGTDDYAKGHDLVSQLVISYKLSDKLMLISRSSYEDYSQLKVENAQRYYNYIPKSENFQSRLELLGDIGPHKLIGGLSYRHISLLSYSDYYNEYLNATDITTDPSTYSITNVFGVVHVPGRPAGEFAAPGASYASGLYPYAITGTQDQSSNQMGIFFQGLFKLTDQFSLLAATRVDRIHESLTDPLPPPGFTAAHDTATHYLKAFDGSLTFKPNAGATFYATVNYNESAVIEGGGGYSGFDGTTIPDANFNIKNYLYEVGAKFSLLDNKLFVGTALYRQERSTTDTFGVTNKVLTKGVEIEANYRPTEAFSATASYSYMDAKLPNANVSAFTGDVYDAFAAPYGNGIGSPNFRALPIQDYRLPGYPQHLFNAFAKYQTKMGIGVSANLVVTGPMYTSYLETVRIPWQHELNASLYYKVESWMLTADFYNITAQKNWAAGGGANGNDLITAALPFHFRVGVRRSF